MIVAPAGSPPWLAAFANQINREMAKKPSEPAAPASVYAINTPDDLVLLPAQENVERVLYVRSLTCLALSTGVQWIRLDTGASI